MQALFFGIKGRIEKYSLSRAVSDTKENIFLCCLMNSVNSCINVLVECWGMEV